MKTSLSTKIEKLAGRKELIRYLKNTSWMLGEQMLRIIAGLFVGIWVARYLGPDKFGLFSYVLAFTAILGGIAKLGLDGILVRELVNQPKEQDTYLGTAFWLKMIAAFVIIILIGMFSPLMSINDNAKLYILIIAIGLFFQSFEVVEFYFQSKVLAKIISICKITQLALSSIIKICLVVAEAELIWFVVVALFDTISLAISYTLAYFFHNKSSFHNKFDPSIAKELIKDSWPLMISAVVVLIYMRIDQIMIEMYLGVYEVGIYSASAKLNESLYFVPVILTTSLFPAIVNAKTLGKVDYENKLKKLYYAVVWSTSVLAFSVFFFADEIVVILFGESYILASSILVIHVWSLIFVGLLTVSNRWLIVEKKTNFIFIRGVCGVIINIFLNYIFIPIYGVTAAAYTTIITLLFSSLVVDFFTKETREHLRIKIMPFYPNSKLFIVNGKNE